METPKTFTRNKYGVRIVKCCASCRFKQLDNRSRLCTSGEGTVPASYLCQGWEISPSLDNVGKGNGDVKKAEYLKYSITRLFNDYNESVTDKQKGIRHKWLTIADVRDEFQRKYGDIYMIRK